ncbi:carboxylesterase 4A [Folsomia candida]|uniref:carboxylesterase 4A n=1 Tax=Folsomia candida TaxID=158441 RepID=UPI000B8EEDFF|nr:carboxylesterase 4A [Folsomia candida]
MWNSGFKTSSYVYAILLFGVILTVGGNHHHHPPTVTLGQGVLQGVPATSRGGRSYNAFYGVPFGKVKKRFEISEPADGWSGIRIANKPGPSCVNSGLFFGKVTGSEDCLLLDVYSPQLRSNESSQDEKLLPVMVWLYGGGFVEGSKNGFGGAYFMDEDVVLVIINYRLGAFGFLNAGVASARGNQGMKDQVLALRWIRDNIFHFSGDKDKVTIFGESAGAVSASLLTLSPMADGLFHRVIMQSGTAGMPFFYHGVDGRDLAVKLAKEVDCPSSNMEYLVECLQRLDPSVFGPHARMVNELGFDESGLYMGPSYETYLPSDNSTEDVFLSEDPYEIARRGNFSKVPMILGLAAFETYSGAIYTTKHDHLRKQVNHQWGRVGPNMLFLTKSAEDPALANQAARAHFLGGSNVEINKTTMMQYEQLGSDRHLIHPFRIFAELYSKHVPVYLYNFTHMIPIVKHKDPRMAMFLPTFKDGQTRRLPSHADELSYQFQMKELFAAFFQPIGHGHEDEAFSHEFVATWAKFADTGKPDGPWGEWTAFRKDDPNRRKVLHIENPPKLEPIPDSWETNSAFWASLNLKEYGGKWKSEN